MIVAVFPAPWRVIPPGTFSCDEPHLQSPAGMVMTVPAGDPATADCTAVNAQLAAALVAAKEREGRQKRNIATKLPRTSDDSKERFISNNELPK
jgi:hypothetical protein